MAKKLDGKAKHGGARIPTKSSLYAKASKYSVEMLDILVDLARNAQQESVRMSAAGKVLDKALADLKTTEVEVSGDVRVHIVEDKHNNNE